MLLREMEPGQFGRVVSFRPGSRDYRARLFSLGLLPGTEFEITRVAPLGDPVEIKVRGSQISVRKQEIEIVEVEVKEP